MSHTPGPWKVTPCYEGLEITSGKYRVALVGNSIRFSEDEAIENANLIAAAPELLEACEAAIKYNTAIQKRCIDGVINIMDTGGAVAMGDDLDDLYNDWINKARVAIAKANGELTQW